MGISLKEAHTELEKLYIEKVVSMCRGNRTRASKMLGMHRNTLNKKIELYGLNGNHSES
jgi:DNA-binding protein Fis